MIRSKKQIVSFFFCGLFMCLLCGCVQPELTIYGTISGVVKDAMTNKTLEGVRVTTTPRGLSQVTESDGQFMFTDLETGDYTLTFEKVGWESVTQKVTVTAGNSSSVQITLFENQIGMTVTPEQLNFGNTVTTMQLVMQNDKKTVYYQASTTANWISLSQTSGSITNGKEVLYVSVSRAGLSAGEHTGSVKITVGDKYITIPVVIIVDASALPVVSLETITNTTESEIFSSGVLQSVGVKNGVSDYGVCYSATNQKPTINDAKQTMGSSSEPKSFTCALSGLKADQVYFLRAYAINEKGIAYSENVLTAHTQKETTVTEDYSRAKVNSGNYKIDLNLISCLRTGNRVTIEATVLNKSITPYTSFSTAEIGLTKLSYLTHVEDDVFTDYSRYDMTLYLNNTSGNSLSSAIMPIGVTKKFTITIDNVPHSATKLNVYIAGQFYNTNPAEYCYFTFENVPIY